MSTRPPLVKTMAGTWARHSGQRLMVVFNTRSKASRPKKSTLPVSSMASSWRRRLLTVCGIEGSGIRGGVLHHEGAEPVERRPPPEPAHEPPDLALREDQIRLGLGAAMVGEDVRRFVAG